MTRIFEADKLNAGHSQLILENELISVLLQPEIGGRILDVEAKGSRKASLFPFLHRTYPKSVEFGPYTEYGGIEECIGSPLTSRLWKTPWRVDKGTDSVTLSVISSTRFSKILLSKTLSLEPDEPILKIEYSFTNFDQKFNKFTFGIHPELCLGNALKSNTYYFPIDGEILSGGFTELGFKQFVTPHEGWGAVVCNGPNGSSAKSMVFGMLFPPKVIDSIEIYYPRIGTHFVVQPLIYGVGLSPNRRASFVSMFYFGDGDVDTIRDLYAQKRESLTMSYVPIELPAEHLVSEEWLKQRRPLVTLPFEEFGQPPLNPLMPSVEPAVPNAQVPPPIHGRAAPDVPKILREHRRFDHTQITDIRLSNVNGSIYVEAWEEDVVALETILQSQEQSEEAMTREIEDARPEVIQHGGLLLVRAKGEAQQKVVINQYLRVPQRGIHTLELNFVNGEATVINVQPDRLKMSSMAGSITIRGAIADGAEYDINTGSGSIYMELPDSTAS
ncbi:MAG: hypothetical protein O7E52_07855, partial [Candidatus Poribacteria bacterium]|nr:hypothetical protein [Candidatus Poribacteria bacterium]